MSVKFITCNAKLRSHLVRRHGSLRYYGSIKISSIFIKTKGLFETYYLELEYRFVRNLLEMFYYAKVVKLKDKQLKRQLLDQIWQQKDLVPADFAKIHTYVKKVKLIYIYVVSIH